MKSYIKYIVGAILFAAFFCGYYFLAPHVMYFQEQHHLFLWATDYWEHMAHYRGWAYPLMAFIVQFSYYPALGAAVWALVLTLIYLMLQSIVYRLSGRRDLLQVTALLPVWLFSTCLSIDKYPVKPVEWLVYVFAVWVVAMIIGRFLPWTKRKPQSVKKEAKEETEAQPEGTQLPHPAKKKKNLWVWLSPLMAVMFMAVGYQIWVKDLITGPIHEAERSMLETERAVRNREWDEVVKRTNEWSATGRKNHLMSYFRSLGLYHTGQLYDHLLDFPQTFGMRSLFFPWRGDKNQAEYGHYVYQDLGQINEAHRWVFEALVGWGETAPLLNYLVEYNIAMGRPAVADKFLSQLEKSLFYRSRAAYLRECLENGEVPGVRYAMANASDKPVRWTNVINLGGETRFILNNDPDNEMAKQYLIMAMLLVGNREAVIRNLQDLYPASENPKLPRILQEALLMYRMAIGHDAVDAMGYTISPENEERFRAYMKENAKGDKARFTFDQRRSYWYYIQHILPSVNHDFSRVSAQTQS